MWRRVGLRRACLQTTYKTYRAFIAKGSGGHVSARLAGFCLCARIDMYRSKGVCSLVHSGDVCIARATDH